MSSGSYWELSGIFELLHFEENRKGEQGEWVESRGVRGEGRGAGERKGYGDYRV